MAGFLIANAHVDIQANTEKSIQSIANLITKLVAVGPAVGGAGAVVAGLMGSVTAGIVAAGAATGAFALAAKPQLQQVTDVTTLYADAQKAAADGASDAGAKQKAYLDALNKLPPATRATAVAFIGLKGDFKKWSDSLASSTMPVFTKGIGVLRDILPSLSPLAKTAANAFSNFMDDIGNGVKSGGFKKFMDGLNETAKKTLPDLLSAGKDVFRGIAGIISAFLPSAGDATDSIAGMAKKFGDWGQNLQNNPGFKNFMTFVKDNAPKIGDAIANIVTVVKKLIEALAPLAGPSLSAIQGIANALGKLPAPVLLGIAAAFVVLRIALLGFSIASTLTGTAMGPLIASTWEWTAALLANPMTWIVLGIMALIAAIILIATKTTWFQTAWSVCWGGIKIAFDAVWGALKTAWNAMGQFFTVTIPGWLTSLKNWFVSTWNSISNKASEIWTVIKAALSAAWNSIKSTATTVWTSIKSFFSTVWNGIKSIVNTVLGWIKNFIQLQINGIKAIFNGLSSLVSTVTGYFGRIKDGVVGKVNSLISTIKGIPGKVKSGLGNLGNLLYSAGQSILKGLISGVTSMIGSLKSKFSSITGMIPSWKGPMDVDLKLLEPSGQALMTGLMVGVGSQVPALQGQLGDITTGIPSAVGVGAPATAPTSGGVTVNLTMDIKCLTMPTTQERRDFAKATVKEFSDELRNYEKERR